MTDLRVPAMSSIKAVVDTLADLGIDALHLRLHAEAHKVGDTRPDVSMWIDGRTAYFRVCEAFKAKPVERMARQPGQREWYAERDTDDLRLLIQCVSFQFQDDWEPRPTTSTTEQPDLFSKGSA